MVHDRHTRRRRRNTLVLRTTTCFATRLIGSLQCHSEHSSIQQSLRLTVLEHCPAYFSNVCIPVAGISGRANLRSAEPERHGMLVPSTKTQLGRRSLHVAARAVWNALPSQLRSSSISRAFPVAAARAWNSLPLETRACSSLLTFRRETKSHLFRQSYG